MTRSEKKRFARMLEDALQTEGGAKYVLDQVIAHGSIGFVLHRLRHRHGDHEVMAAAVGAKPPPLTPAEEVSGIPGYGMVKPVDEPPALDVSGLVTDLLLPSVPNLIEEFQIRLGPNGPVCGKDPGPFKATLTRFREHIIARLKGGSHAGSVEERG